MKNQYFAAVSREEIVSQLCEKKDDFYAYLNQSGHFNILRTVYRQYYRPYHMKGQLLPTGEVDHLLETSVNHMRNVIQHVISSVTSQRIYYEPKAINTKIKSMKQAQLASGLLEYYTKAKNLENYFKMAAESAQLYGEAFVYMFWNPTKGEQIATGPNGQPIFEGDIEIMNLNGVDVIRDYTKKENDEHNWVILRTYTNRHDLAAKYTEHREELLAIENDDWRRNQINIIDYHKVREDDIPVYILYHKPSEALPQGRMVEFAGDVVLYDGPMPYDHITAYRIAPGEMTGSIFGYTNLWDMLPVQLTVDKLNSSITTNQAAFGVQNVTMPRGSGINVVELQGNLNIIEYDATVGGKPEPLNLTHTPSEVFGYEQQMVKVLETLGGVGAVARNNESVTELSGSAMALLQSMAVQFSQNFQHSYVKMVEDIGSGIISLLKTYAQTPRVAFIAGKNSRNVAKTFKGDDLANIQRVTVDFGNPLMRTIAGRQEIAKELANMGMVKNPNQYLEVLTTGRLEPMYESELSQLNLIREENERLLNGQGVRALWADDHQMHIEEHLALLANPEVRYEEPELIELVRAHVEEHQMLMNPQVEAMTQTPAETGQNAVSAEEVNSNNQVLQPQPGVDVNAPDMPQMPKIAGTDQRFDPEGGNI